MRISRAIPPAVYLAEQQFNVLLAFEARDGSAASVAAANDCRPSTLYERRVRVIEARTPKRRGRRPDQRALLRRAQQAESRVLQLQVDNSRLEHVCARTLSRRERLLTCTLHTRCTNTHESE